MYKRIFFFLIVRNFFENRGKIWPKNFFRLISMQFYFGTNQTILRISFTFKKKKFDEKMLDIFSVVEFFFFAGGLALPHPPPGLRSWTPHDFGLKTLVGTGSRSTASIKKSLFFLKIVWIVPKNVFIEIGRKKIGRIFHISYRPCLKN